MIKFINFSPKLRTFHRLKTLKNMLYNIKCAFDTFCNMQKRKILMMYPSISRTFIKFSWHIQFMRSSHGFPLKCSFFTPHYSLTNLPQP